MCKNVWRLAFFLILSLILLMGSSADEIHAETHLQPAPIISGRVEMSTDGETWKPFSQESTLKAGDSIRTGGESAVSLKADDGSVLYLEEQTLLKITELTFSTIDQARIFRFNLKQGTLTARAGKVESQANVFEVKTRSALVRLHGHSSSETETSARIIANSAISSQSKGPLLASASNTKELLSANVLPPIGSTGTTGMSEAPFTSKVLPLSGKFDMEQLNNEKTLIEVTVGSGIVFTMNIPGQTISLSVDGGKISLTSSQPLPNMFFVASGGTNNSVQLTNSGQDDETPPQFDVNGYNCSMGSDSSLELTITRDSPDREFSLSLPGIGVEFSFSFSQDPSAQQDQLQVIQGAILLDGRPLSPGEIVHLKRKERFGEPPSVPPGNAGGGRPPMPKPTVPVPPGSRIQP